MNVTNAVAEFGARVGRPGLQLPADGAVAVEVDGLGLTLASHSEELLIVALIAAPFLETARLIEILCSLDIRRRRPEEPPIQIARHGQADGLHLIASVRWPAESVSAQNLGQSVDALLRFRREWFS